MPSVVARLRLLSPLLLTLGCSDPEGPLNAEARAIRRRSPAAGAGCRITIQVSSGTWVGTYGTPADSTIEPYPR